MFATIVWHGGTHRVDDLATLNAELDRIETEIDSKWPQAIVVERHNGDSLTVLLGAPTSFLSYVAKSGDAPYFSSLGDPTAKGCLTFYVDGDHHSETELFRAIQPTLARQAIGEFVMALNGLPKCVSWCMV